MSDPIKQVILIRKDLKMRRGKEIAQGAHASMSFLSHLIRGSIDRAYTLAEGIPDQIHIKLTPEELSWLTGSFAKVCLQVTSEAELLELHKRAIDAGLRTGLIQDSGKTEFNGVPTYTALAIGPHFSNKIDPITGHLSLY